MFIGPLALIGIQIGASLLAKKLGGKQSAGSSAATAAANARTKIETDILRKKSGFIDDLAGFQGRVSQQILGDDGKPLVIRLPGVGGISGKEFSKLLEQMVGNTDFGGMREMGLLKDLIQLSSPGGNTAGVSAQLAGQEQAQIQSNRSGIANFLSDAAPAVINSIGGGGGGGAAPIPNITDLSPIQPIDTSGITDIDFAPNPFGDQG